MSPITLTMVIASVACALAWVASLATPLIAYKDRFQEAIPLLQFAEPILERQPKKYAAEIADINVAYAWISLRQGRLAESADAWQKALNARERAPGLQQIELQKVLVGQRGFTVRRLDSCRRLV